MPSAAEEPDEPPSENPRAVDQAQDNVNFAFWHSVSFSQKADKAVLTDELGGGAATCNAAIGPNRGADGVHDGIHDVVGEGDQRGLVLKSSYKIPRHRADTDS